MGLLLTLIAGLTIWIIGWAIGIKSFDVFLLTLLLLVIAAAAHFVWALLPGNRTPDRPS